MVAGPAGISAAIVDLSPVVDGLPETIESALISLDRPTFRQERDLPGWGTIFSSHVRFIRPDGSDEEESFLKVVLTYLQVLRSAVISAAPDRADDPFTLKRYEGQRHYCLQQKRNDKTRRVLEKAFNSSWADRYISELLFDDPPMPI